MRQVTIERIESDDLGTFGLLSTDGGFSCYTAELPWRDNKENLSCIPAGVYNAKWALSPKHGPCYHLEGPTMGARTDILIHSGNWAGDVEKGLRSNVKGCICLGRAILDICGQKGVAASRDAMMGFENDLDREPFVLTIFARQQVGQNVNPRA